MDFWKSQPRDEGDKESPREPGFADRLTDFVKEEALDSLIDTVSGGWLGLDDFQNDDEDENDRRPAKQAGKQDSFEERLQRELAKLTPQTAEMSGANAEPSVAEVSQPLTSALPDYIPVARPVLARGPQGFGRKLI